MKKILYFILLINIMCLYVGCNPDDHDVENIPLVDHSKIWKDSFSDEYLDYSNIKTSKLFYDGSYIEDYDKELSKRKDIKYEFGSETHTKLVNSSDGYILTFPSNNVVFDYSISQYRIQVSDQTMITTISYENSNPYGNNISGWNIYSTEWLNRYINNSQYLNDNNLSYVHKTSITDKLVDGYETTTYSIVINDNNNITHPYYNITILRKTNEYVKFYLFVSKSKTDEINKHLDIIKSFKTIKEYGVSSNHIDNLELKENPLWNDETKKYFNYLNQESTFDFGFFRYSLADDTDITYRDEYLNKAIKANEDILNTMEYNVEIHPTYTHLGWYDEDHYFPTYSANTIAGGNGFNSKPVLQFTLQFTRNNNNVSSYNTSSNYTPMFDILRGKYDEYFRKLGNQIKNYSKPVLFRLNNEMNTDWTSYCGIISLLDPDIFKLTWIRMYEIFDEVGVDNCIWIFNPIARSCPYSSWGEDLCYMPGNDYVQALGLTYYEMLNTDFYLDFRISYNELYKKNYDVWKNFPWIISEFGCGSGGNSEGLPLYRNEEKQAQWITDMFNAFSDKKNNPYVQKISVAVWFNCNDYDGNGNIVNALNIDASQTKSINAFKEGFKKITENNK